MVFGKNITAIPDYCFNHCESLKTLAIPSTITKIGVRAFSYCDNLTEMVITKEIENVVDRAFSGCKELEFVTFENANVSIGSNVFENSPKTVVIAPDNTNAKKYCEDNNLRWSTAKDIEAVVLGEKESSDTSDTSSENTANA